MADPVEIPGRSRRTRTGSQKHGRLKHSPPIRPLSEKLTPYLCFGLLLLALLFSALIRYRFANLPLERDEGEYAYAGQLMLQGIPPYQMAYSMKMPGIFAAYAVIMAVFGQSPFGIRLGLMLVNAAATVLMFFLARRLFGWLAAVVASASYALLSTSYVVLGFFAHATQFAVPLALAGILLLLQAMKSSRLWMFFSSGLLLGLGFLMKQPGGAFILFAAAYLIGAQWKAPWKPLISRVTALLVGSAVPMLITGLILWHAGVFPQFWFWTVSYAREYASEVALSKAPELLWYVVPGARSEIFLGALAVVGLTSIWWNARARSLGLFLILFLALSALAVTPGFYFRKHYFVLMLPALSLLIAVAVSSATENFRARRFSRATQAIPALLFVAAFAGTLWWQRDMLFRFPPAAVGEFLYPGQPFAAAEEIGSYIDRHTPANARVAVFGSEPEIYFYSRRHSATGYIYMYPLTEPQRYASVMQQQMLAEVEKARPEIVVLVFVQESWLFNPSAIFVAAEAYVKAGYKLTGAVDVSKPANSVWGETAQYHPLAPPFVLVYRRIAP